MDTCPFCGLKPITMYNEGFGIVDCCEFGERLFIEGEDLESVVRAACADLNRRINNTGIVLDNALKQIEELKAALKAAADLIIDAGTETPTDHWRDEAHKWWRGTMHLRTEEKESPW